MKFVDPLIPHDADAQRVRDGLFDLERRRVLVPTFQIAAGDNTYGILNYLKVEGAGIAALGTNLDQITLTPGYDNRLINGCFRINQRAPATNADDTYAHDRWYALTQSNAIALSTLTDVEDTTPYMARLTQSNAAAQRIGYAQIIEGKNCKDLRGQIVTFSFRSRLSSSANIRYAVLEWTGTEDAVTSDVVLDWTSSTYTANAFFLAANLTVSGVGSYAMTAATLATPDKLTVTLGSSFNNLIVFVWTEGTAAQNVTLDIGKVKLEPGSAASRYQWRDITIEDELCQRYLPVWNWSSSNDTIGHGYSISTTQSFIFFNMAVRPRVKPTGATVTNPTNMTLANATNAQGAITGLAWSMGGSGVIQTLIETHTAGTPTTAAGDGCFLFGTAASQILFTGCEL